MTPAHGFMFVNVHYVDNVCNVKTNRGGVTGHIFLACKTIIHTNTFILLCNFHQVLYYMCLLLYIL